MLTLFVVNHVKTAGREPIFGLIVGDLPAMIRVAEDVDDEDRNGEHLWTLKKNVHLSSKEEKEVHDLVKARDKSVHGKLVKLVEGSSPLVELMEVAKQRHSKLLVVFASSKMRLMAETRQFLKSAPH